MSRKVKGAVIQMDAAPAPLSERLSRAAGLIAEAAGAGAQLVVLPELFNSGYVYDVRNFEAAEQLDGATVTWMKQRAAQHAIHLVGTLLLRDEEDIYDSQLLVAPDGKLWRYDKNYPFAWERAYFREGRTITIADTELGRLGLLICWDCAHAEMWARYAGKVDAMVISSCPPKLSNADLVFPDGARVNAREWGGIWDGIYTEEEYFPGPDLDEHAAWLGVPVLHATGSGIFRSRLPYAALSTATYLAARPDLWDRVAQANEVMLETGYDRQAKIIDGAGQVLARVNDQGDGFTTADVTLADMPQSPSTAQPAMRTSPLAYALADVAGVATATASYRQAIRRRWGPGMAPVDPHTRLWVTAVLGALLAGWLWGRSRRHRPAAHHRHTALRTPRSN